MNHTNNEIVKKEEQKLLKYLINEFHLASLITADKQLGFEAAEKNKAIFEAQLQQRIERTLQSQREEMVEKVKKLKNGVCEELIINGACGHFHAADKDINAALDTAISIITSKKV